MDILSQVVPFPCIIMLLIPLSCTFPMYHYVTHSPLIPLSLTIGSMTQECKNDQALLQYAFSSSTKGNLL